MNKLNATQAGIILGIERHQVVVWIKTGKLKGYRPPDAKKTTGYQIDSNDVYDLLKTINAPITEKKCSRCKVVKSLDNFGKYSRAKDGHRGMCLSCRREQGQEDKDKVSARAKEYRKKNKDKIEKRRKEKREQNKEAVSAMRKAYYNKKRDKIRAKSRERYATDPDAREQIKDYAKQYRKKNPEKVKQSTHSWVSRNPEKVRRYRQNRVERNPGEEVRRNREYYRNNADEFKKKAKEYRKANPDKRAQHQAKRRAKQQGQVIECTLVVREEIIKRDKSTCYICGKASLNNSEIHLDHIIPLSKGGSHTPENVHVTCIPCNGKKHIKTIDEVIYLIEAGVW